MIDPEFPVEANIDVRDIAWSLSRINRFSGHTVTEIPYNVAAHSVFVADMIYAAHGCSKLALIGLLHDAAEAYIGDIPSPVKKIESLRKVLEPIEERILDVVYSKFIGSIPTSDQWSIVKHFDKRSQFIEAWNFIASRGVDWPGRDQHDISLIDIQNFPQPIPSIQAYSQFMSKFNELTKK